MRRRSRPSRLPLALSLPLLLLAAGTASAQRATFPIEPGQLVLTCRPPQGLPGFVAALVDIRDPACSGAILGANWLAPSYHNELPNPTSSSADIWHSDNMGFVFGITLDDAVPPSVYVTSTSVWGGAGISPLANVFRLRGSDGKVERFANLPNSGQGLGNIAYDKDHGQFFITNHEDGKIYRVSLAGTVLDSFDPFFPDDGTSGFAPLGERLWAVGVHQYRVYFSVWVEDQQRPDPARANSVWSVGIDPLTGAFDPVDLTFEIEVPPLLVGGTYSNPISDIAFADNDWMIVAERPMNNDTSTSAHSGRALEFSGGHLGWSPSPHLFRIGAGVGAGGTNSAGGIDYDCPVVDACNDGRRVWVMGDALILQTGLAIYGLQGVPDVGGGVPESYLVDLDGDVSGGGVAAKTSLGCVEVYRPTCILTADAGDPVSFCGSAPPVTLDASGSSVSGCGGTIEYRWLAGPTLIRDWQPTPTVTVIPTSTTTYRLETRCGRCPCFAADSVTITIRPDITPGSLGNTLRQVRQGLDVDFTWAGTPESATFVLYRGTVKQTWPPAPYRSGLLAPSDRLRDVPAPPTLYFYRVAGVSCSGAEGV